MIDGQGWNFVMINILCINNFEYFRIVDIEIATNSIIIIPLLVCSDSHISANI